MSKKPKLEEITRKVLSYCDIPKEVSENSGLDEYGSDVYVEVSITSKSERFKYTDNWGLDNWILSHYPELEGQTIFIYIDY